MQQVVGREASLLEDEVSADLLKLTSQNQQLVSGRAGDQLLDLGPGITSVRLPRGDKIPKDTFGPSRVHLRADKVESWIQDDLSVQNVSIVMQCPLSCGRQQDINVRPLTQPPSPSCRFVDPVFSPGTCSDRKAECLETKSLSC